MEIGIVRREKDNFVFDEAAQLNGPIQFQQAVFHCAEFVDSSQICPADVGSLLSICSSYVDVS